MGSSRLESLRAKSEALLQPVLSLLGGRRVLSDSYSQLDAMQVNLNFNQSLNLALVSVLAQYPTVRSNLLNVLLVLDAIHYQSKGKANPH